MTLEQNFLQYGWLYAFHLWYFCFLERDRVVNVFICYFLYKVPNFLWIGIGVYFLSEGSPGESFGFFDGMSSFCSLYLFQCSGEGFVLNFLRVAWRSLIVFLNSSVNHGLLYFGDIVVWGIVLLAMVMKVLVKCLMGSSWFLFYFGICVVRHSFLLDCQFALLKLPCGGLFVVPNFYGRVLHNSFSFMGHEVEYIVNRWRQFRVRLLRLQLLASGCWC